MRTTKYSQREFIDTYRADIGYIISLIKSRCRQNTYKIVDETKLFKNLLYIIFIQSDQRKLIY